jgi:predicted nucleic acid-binding protein
MKIYIDVCCLNRPFDDQTQDRIRLETEAVVLVLEHVEDGEWDLIGSDVMRFEIGRIQDTIRRRRAETLFDAIKRNIRLDDSVVSRARELERLGIPGFDSLHVACAEKAGADVLLTTDDRLVRQAARSAKVLGVSVRNPVEWLREEKKS